MKKDFMSEQQNSHPLDRVECPHCGLWFKLEEAPPSKDLKKLKCPYCDWAIEKGI